MSRLVDCIGKGFLWIVVGCVLALVGYGMCIELIELRGPSQCMLWAALIVMGSVGVTGAIAIILGVVCVGVGIIGTDEQVERLSK